MHSFRKKNGFNAVEKIIKIILPDTPLVMNLKNEDCMRILLYVNKTLEERFAEIDSKKVREELT